MTFKIHQLTLTQFRSHPALRLQMDGASFVVLCGPNGSGKTNILEAISLLAPGRGLRGVDTADYLAKTAAAQDIWSVAAEVEGAQNFRTRISTTAQAIKTPSLSKPVLTRQIRVDGKNLAGHAEILPFFLTLWLTPQMDGLFLDAASERRRFFDRLTAALKPEHAARLARYEKNIRARLKLLTGPSAPDTAWLSSLEAMLAADAVQISLQRQDMLRQLQEKFFVLSTYESSFPSAVFVMDSWLDQTVVTLSPQEAQAQLSARFLVARTIDRQTGRTSEGAGKSDIVTLYADKNMPAAQSSTGEQKALLLSIIMAHALLLKEARGSAPVLLFDEVAAHLDERRRRALFGLLSSLGGQVWLSGTDMSYFSSIASNARVFSFDAPPPPGMGKETAG